MAADIRLLSGYPAGKTGGQLKMKKKKRMSLKEKTQLKWGVFLYRSGNYRFGLF